MSETNGRIGIKDGHVRVEIRVKTAWYEKATGTYTGRLPDELKPALLAALLVDAGAVKVDSKFIDNNEIIYDAMLDLDEHELPPGEYYVLSIPDGTP